MTIDNEADLRGLLAAGRLVGETLQAMAAEARPGVTTAELDEVARERLRRAGARPAPAITYGFPGVACISVNDEAAHGIPGPRVLAANDLVKLDLSLELGGYFADAALTVAVPPVEERRQRLCDATRRVLAEALDAARAGRPLRAIGRAAERAASRAGFNVIRELNGHGVGRALHEAPSGVPHYDDPLARATLHEGLVLTIEPHVALGRGRIYQAADGWTLKTRDGSPVANFEHTVVITSGKPLVVTAV
jgi:methionyl aminopeptidase